MAKKKLENIKKKKVDILQSIKLLTKWITNTRRSDEQLVELINRYGLKNNIARRIMSYNFGFPYIIKYFNEYFNGLYDFESYDTKALIKSIVYLMDVNNRSNGKVFMFIKSSELKDEIKNVIKNLIKDYLLTVYNIECNRRDLDVYYKLFKLGVIKDEDLLEIDKLLNGDKPLIKSLDFINYSDAIKVQDPDNDSLSVLTDDGVKVFSEPINNFINEIKELKTTVPKCKACPLYSKPIVVLDTNVKDLGEVDVVFIGLNPGKEEAEKDLPFVGDSSGGKYIRTIIDQLPRNTKWVIFNIILCSTSNKNEITAVGSVNDIIRDCLNLTNKIFEKFPSKLFIPIGDDAKSMFGITEKISAASGKVFVVENDVKIIPLIHPSSVLRNSKNKAIYDKSAQNIVNFINPTGTNTSTNTGTNTRTTNKSAEVPVELAESEKDLLLLDVKRIEGNKILMIYTDYAGKKKYIIKDYLFPVLIRNKDWNECDMITDKFHDVCQLTDWQKSNVSKKCHQLLKQMTEV